MIGWPSSRKPADTEGGSGSRQPRAAGPVGRRWWMEAAAAAPPRSNEAADRWRVPTAGTTPSRACPSGPLSPAGQLSEAAPPQLSRQEARPPPSRGRDATAQPTAKVSSSQPTATDLHRSSQTANMVKTTAPFPSKTPRGKPDKDAGLIIPENMTKSYDF